MIRRGLTFVLTGRRKPGIAHDGGDPHAGVGKKLFDLAEALGGLIRAEVLTRHASQLNRVIVQGSRPLGDLLNCPVRTPQCGE